jgi:putative aldouronate transport system permease protein
LPITKYFNGIKEVVVIRYSYGYKAFATINVLLLTFAGLLCVLPLIHVFSVSLSSSWAATTNAVTFFPIDFTMSAYAETFNNSLFLIAFSNGLIRTVLGTLISIFLIVLAAYPLSRNDHRFKGRTLYAWYFVFPMLFSGGLIPTYLVVMNTGLLNSIWALIIPTAINVWILILMLNFFRSIPQELEDAAMIDGAGHFTTIFRIFLPISRPAIATFSLFILVFHWNSWFDGLIYISRIEKYPLATFLRTIVVEGDFSRLSMDQEKLKLFSARTIKSSQIVIASLPVLIVYPFLQKHFAKGIILGSVKE